MKIGILGSSFNPPHIGHLKISERAIEIFKLDEVSDVFAHPLCSDTGAAAGAALNACYKENGIRPLKLKSLALGFEETIGINSIGFHPV